MNEHQTIRQEILNIGIRRRHLSLEYLEPQTPSHERKHEIQTKLFIKYFFLYLPLLLFET